MIAALISIAVLLALAVGGLVVVALRSQLATGPTLCDRTVVVNTRKPDDQSVRGVLVAQHADRVTLREVVYLHGSGDQPLRGLVHVPVANIAWIQEIDESRGG